MGIRVSSPEPVPVGSKPRKGFVILGAQHAREWIATSTALYVAHALAADPAAQPKDSAKLSLRHLLDHFEFYVIPLPNPDGYEYTRKFDRLWYKNRQHVTPDLGLGVCKGIDMNRNWVCESSS
jgi:extracellular matrix protein 14